MRRSLRILRLRAMLLQGLATGLTAGTLKAGLEINWEKEGKDGKDPERARRLAGWLAGRGRPLAQSWSFVRPSDAFLTNAMDQLPDPV
jgi:hypothetical protein